MIKYLDMVRLPWVILQGLLYWHSFIIVEQLPWPLSENETEAWSEINLFVLGQQDGQQEQKVK